MPTRNVHLTPHLNKVVEASITSGRFSNASEVVREALRLLELRDAREQAYLDWLRAETEESFASLDRGDGLRFDSVNDLNAHIDQLAEEVKAETTYGGH